MQIYTNETFDQRLISNCAISELENRQVFSSSWAGAAVENLIQRTFQVALESHVSCSDVAQLNSYLC